MAFVSNITKALYSEYDNAVTYNFNKSIGHFIYGMNDRKNPFECIYNNGTSTGSYWGYSSNAYATIGTMSCNANSITVPIENYYNNKTECTLDGAVIIYPAKYGDVTLS